MKVTIVYWSGTGNTEMMANAVAEGAKNAGAEVQLLPVATADADVLASDVILFGCPAMGSEELEEGEFEPFFSSVESGLSGKWLVCSAPTTGETASGCVPGRRVSFQTAA